jgi:hypothetical protein
MEPPCFGRFARIAKIINIFSSSSKSISSSDESYEELIYECKNPHFSHLKSPLQMKENRFGTTPHTCARLMVIHGGGAVERPLDWSSAGEEGAAAAWLPTVNWSSSGAPKKLMEYRRALIYDG